MDGKLIIIAAPSGSGKTSIVKFLLEQNLNLFFSVSATTRKMRQNEKDGVDYHFISEEEFLDKIEKNQFVEWQEVYNGTHYGTLKSEVDAKLAQGKNIVFDVDVIGGLNIKKMYGDKALSIFIKPPTLEELTVRLRKRGTESEESLQKRLAKAMFELEHETLFDVTIINDELSVAQEEAVSLIKSFINK